MNKLGFILIGIVMVLVVVVVWDVHIVYNPHIIVKKEIRKQMNPNNCGYNTVIDIRVSVWDWDFPMKGKILYSKDFFAIEKDPKMVKVIEATFDKKAELLKLKLKECYPELR